MRPFRIGLTVAPLALVVAALLVASPLASAQPLLSIYDQIAPSPGGGRVAFGLVGEPPTLRNQAVRVETAFTGELRVVELYLELDQTADDLTIALTEDDGGAPGSALDFWIVEVAAGAASLYSLTSQARPVLFADQDYWVAVLGPSDQRAFWPLSAVTGTSLSGFPGPPWNPPFVGGCCRLRVLVAPEPAPGATWITAVAALCLLRATRRARA